MFQQAVATLFKPGEFAASLFSEKEDSYDGSIICLDSVKNPSALPSYWTLSIPQWYDPAMGDIEVRGEQHWRKLKQSIGTKPEDQNVEVFVKHPPFLVFEVDYLLVEDKVDTSPAIKKLQREAMAYAFQASGFPFACLVDSGGKSIHAYVRLEDSIDEIAAYRSGPDFKRLQDLAWVVFGHFDRAVMKEAGRVRLVRTPGATREDGSPQTIIAVGQRVKFVKLMEWFHNQLSREAAVEVWGRDPVTTGNSPLRGYYLRLRDWRRDLMQEHQKGERGTHWLHVSKKLAVAGCMKPEMIIRPSAQAPLGQWRASWLWHVSAYTFNAYSRGWFYSQSSMDWSSDTERLRWFEPYETQEYLKEFANRERSADPLNNTVVEGWQSFLEQQEEEKENQELEKKIKEAEEAARKAAALPPPLPPGPNMHPGVAKPETVGQTLTEDPNVQPPKAGGDKKPPKEKKNIQQEYSQHIGTFFTYIPKQHLKKLSSLHAEYWKQFDEKRGIWKNIAPEAIRSLIQHRVFAPGTQQKHIVEVFKTIEHHEDILMDESWVENEHATAFANGTLYVKDGAVDFQKIHNPADRLCCRVPFNYDVYATCPQWEKFVRWALPDSSRLSLLQEAFGYTLVAGQPFQSFFLFTGVGSNGKSVVLSILRQIHQESYEAVPLASLGDKFGLGTLANKRLAIDTEAESAGAGRNGNDMALAQNILKAWTGDDPVKAEAKKVQGWSTKVSAKYFLSANRRPKFMDPSKGVWRRLKLLKFESVVDEKNQIPNLDKILAQEMSGIINWAITGLLRLYAQNGFTTSPVLTADIHEYQNDTDSAFQFFNMFFRSDPNAGWHDIRPVYQAYKAYCAETGCYPVNEAEFRMRLGMKNVAIGQPEDHEVVYGAPFGQTRIPGKQYWAIKNFRCLHPTYLTAQVVGLHPAGAVAPQTMLQGVAR